MLTNCEQKVMEIVMPQPFRSYSIKEISRLIKSSYALTHESVKQLVEKKTIKTKKIGNSTSCQLNLSANPQLLAVSSLVYSHKLLSKVQFGFVIDEIKDKFDDLIYIMILFGSYAKRKATKKSDVDLLFVVQNEKDVEKTKKRVKSVISSTNINVEFETVTIAWLLKMFEERYSVGREVLEGSVVLHGAEQYYTLVRAYDQKRGH